MRPEQRSIMQMLYDELPAEILLQEEETIQEQIQDLHEQSSMVAKAILNKVLIRADT